MLTLIVFKEGSWVTMAEKRFHCTPFPTFWISNHVNICKNKKTITVKRENHILQWKLFFSLYQGRKIHFSKWWWSRCNNIQIHPTPVSLGSSPATEFLCFLPLWRWEMRGCSFIQQRFTEWLPWASQLGFKSPLSQLQAVGPWASYLASLCSMSISRKR